MYTKHSKKPNKFRNTFVILLFSFVIPSTLFNTSIAYSQEEATEQTEDTSLYTTELQAGNQVIEQVNSIESGEMIGRIDWENRVIYSVGDGVMPPDAISAAQARVRSKRAAIDEAYGRMIEMANEVRIDAESTTRNFVNENRVVRTKVSGLVKHAEIEEIKQHDDGSYQVMMKMPMDGAKGLSIAILPVQMERVRKIRVISSTKSADFAMRPDTPSDTPSDAPSQIPTKEKITSKKEIYTGIIIVAQGLGANPAIFPTIKSEDGIIVYDLTSANPNTSLEDGLAVYRKSRDAARQVASIGNNPLIIIAQKADGRKKTNIVVSASDAQKVLQVGNENGIFEDARVVIVID